MPASLVWIQRPHIVCAEFSGEVTTDDILHIAEEFLEIVERRPAYFLIDASDIRLYPANLVSFIYSHHSTVQLIQHRNSRAVALVNGSHILRLAMEIIMRNRNYEAFEEREAALAFLRSFLREDQNNL